MFIHLFILEKSGACVYSKVFGSNLNEIDIDLFSGFFIALYSFSKKLFSQFDKNIDVFDIGEYRFIFHDTEKILFIASINQNTSTIAAKAKLRKFKYAFLQTYETDLKDWNGDLRGFRDFEIILNKLEEQDYSHLVNSESISQLSQTLIEDVSDNAKIKGCGLLSIRGLPYLRLSISNEMLGIIIKEIEIRWNRNTSDFERIIFSDKKGSKIILENIQDKLVLVLLFDKDVPTATIEMFTEKCVESIASLDLNKL